MRSCVGWCKLPACGQRFPPVAAPPSQPRQTMSPMHCSPPCSWSVSVNVDSVTQTSATVKLNPPSEGGPFSRFVLSVCPKPASSTPNWDTCPQTTCLPAQAAACPISGLAASSDYTVSAMAYAGNTTTIRSAADDFSTLPWP